MVTRGRIQKKNRRSRRTNRRSPNKRTKVKKNSRRTKRRKKQSSRRKNKGKSLPPPPMDVVFDNIDDLASDKRPLPSQELSRPPSHSTEPDVSSIVVPGEGDDQGTTGNMVEMDGLIKEQGQGEVEQPHTEGGMMSMDELGDESSFASKFLELFPERNESEDTQFVPVPGNPESHSYRNPDERPDHTQPAPMPRTPAQPPGTKVKQVPRRTSISAPERAISKKSKKSQKRSSSAGGGGASAPMDLKKIEGSLNRMPALELRKLNRGVGKVLAKEDPSDRGFPSDVMVEIFTKEELEPKGTSQKRKYVHNLDNKQNIKLALAILTKKPQLLSYYGII